MKNTIFKIKTPKHFGLAVLLLFAGLFVIGLILWMSNHQKPESKLLSKASLSRASVCIISNQIKNRKLNRIEINGKQYYGCCKNCIARLKRNPKEYIYTIDPLNGHIIDKAQAKIMINPYQKNHILYFESDGTYNQYLVLINSKQKR